MVFCEQMQIIAAFNCSDLRLPNILGATPCNANDVYQVYYFSIDYSKCFDLCPFECNQITYDLTISTTDYPSRNTFTSVYTSFGNELSELLGTSNISDVTYDMFKASFAAVFIYFDELKYTNIEQQPTLELVDVIANIGGTLGLFIGISLLSIIECIELIGTLILCMFRSIIQKRSTRKLSVNKK